MEKTEERLFDHFSGSALGTFIGDALGMPVEGWTAEAIQKRYGMLSTMVSGRFPAGYYTDDTEMMISILEVLVEAEGFDPGMTAQRFLKNFHPERGYGERIYPVMDRLAAGESWRRAGTESFGNGGAMRVAPVGFYFHDDPAGMVEAAADQASITHFHSEGLAGAVVQAGAVAMATIDGLTEHRRGRDEFVGALEELAARYDHGFATRLRELNDLTPGDFENLPSQIRKRFHCNFKAIEAVPPAAAAYLYTDSFEEAVILGVNLGGDTDTIGAMTGAIAGAYHGKKAIPRDWISPLENGPLGRDYVIDLCRKAAEIKYRLGPGAGR